VDFSPDGLLLSLLTGAVGMGIFLYGKREQRFPHLIGGVALMICPYLVSGAMQTLAVSGAIVVGIVLAANAGY
jgi:hypothetical protein